MLRGQTGLAVDDFFGLAGVDDEAQGLGVGEIVPDPVEEHDCLVTDAEDAAQVHDEPHEPGEETGHLHGAEFGDGAVATHGGHGAEILVAEGLEGFAFEGGFEVAREKLALLNGDLCQLRVSTRPFRVAFGHDALVADGIDAVETFDAVVFVDDDAASASEVVGREVTDAFGGHAAHPNEGAGGDLRAVFELHAVVGVVGDHLVEQDVDAHALEELLDVGGGFFAHGAQQTRTGFDEVDVH